VTKNERMSASSIQFTFVLVIPTMSASIASCVLQRQTSDIGKGEIGCRCATVVPINVDRSSEKPPAAILILRIESDCADLNWKRRSA